MEMSTLESMLHAISTAARTPVIIILIAFIVFAIFSVGWLIGEALGERRKIHYRLSKLLDTIKAQSDDLPACINASGLFKRQKKILIELTEHPQFDKEMLESMADNLLEDEQAHYDRILSSTNLVAKLAPMLGLLGTLIPLGPGIIALGQGDTLTLSQSMLTAFDTTIAGLIAAGICLVVTTIRKRWYDKYMSDLETLVDCVAGLEIEKTMGGQHEYA